MKLRVHPKLKNWPPQWGGSYRHDDQFLSSGSEDAVLEHAIILGPDRLGPERLQVAVEYEGNEHKGTLLSDDPAFLLQLSRKLSKECLGRPMREIGSLDIDF
jgi:hypothetical protein